MDITIIDTNVTNFTLDEVDKYDLNQNNTTKGFEIENSVVPYIPLYIYVWVSFINVVIFLVGTVGNILVIMVVIKVRDMRTPLNVFLLNLSLADVLVLVVCQPAALLEFFGKDRWFLGEIMCKFFFNYSSISSQIGSHAGKRSFTCFYLNDVCSNARTLERALPTIQEAGVRHN
ncbi:SIFAR-like protein [Mya arenaria]|uniref:SIFAR-like protein n=1 Tax=Mya arenaria TaxID=6604 RepID=A0ABY7FJV5_MYAAR|nr:SIFAR-like protein [Mya arenaria]